jgi:TolB-like protein/DNA-binding winged helix-turn-helix (wHTH) protein/Tfp pilus assembly protein PilF
MCPELQIVHFGAFEVDVRSGELRKHGLKVKLQEQPFRILVMLLECPGEVVTREELRQQLWPEGTFVDFEHALNVAVNRLRDALDDSPDNPRFVETLPRRGYRFIAPVESADVAAPRPVAAPLRPSRAWWGPLALAGLAAALLVILIGLDVGRLRHRLLGGVAPGEITSIAVLPLENLSGDPEQVYFVDGMTEALITNLGKIETLRVISRQSVMRYKNTEKSVREIARELGVEGVIEGSVLRAGNRVRITVQLIEVARDRHLWAESYERDLRDVLALQSEVARTIAREIKIAVTPKEEALLAHTRRIHPEAHEGYLRGRFLWNQRTAESLRESVRYFEEAIEKDPEYALAYAGLADAYVIQPSHGVLSPEQAYPKARAAALKALEIDKTLAEAYATLGLVREGYDWDWRGAEQEYLRSIELNPSYATAHQWYGELLVCLGRHAEARREIDRASVLDPLAPMISSWSGTAHYYARDYDRAIQSLSRTLELHPDFAVGHNFLGWAYIQKGLLPEAIDQFERAKKVEPNRTTTHLYLAHAHALEGNRNEAMKILRQVPQEGYVRPTDLAAVHLALEDEKKAFELLEEALDQRDFQVRFLKVDPKLDALRDRPRFQSLLRRLNFPE